MALCLPTSSKKYSGFSFEHKTQPCIAPDFKYNEGVKFIDLYNAKIASTLTFCFRSNFTSLI